MGTIVMTFSSMVCNLKFNANLKRVMIKMNAARSGNLFGDDRSHN